MRRQAPVASRHLESSPNTSIAAWAFGRCLDSQKAADYKNQSFWIFACHD